MLHLLKHLGIIAVAAFAGFWYSSNSFLPKIYQASYTAGYQAGLANREWEALAAGNQRVANAVCTKWWFGMDHKQRRLDLKLGKPYDPIR